MDDQRLVQMALDQGLITADQVADATREQLALADRGLNNSVWYLLQDLGHLSDQAARELRKKSSSSGVRALEVGGYQIQGRLGAGGMGDVFRGRNTAGDEVAIKLLSAKFQSNEEYQRRFDREARTSMRLRHPHIARSLDAGLVQGTRFMVMELVEGPSLKARIQDQGPISDLEAVFLLEQMAGALGHSWNEGVLHRDVKPANIIIGAPRPGHHEPFCAKLIDFGLAKAWQDAEHSGEESRGGLTGAGLALGTPHYMSPEQASGQADLDQRCDIYGLGASLFHALMGHTMYSGKSSAVIMYKQVTEQIDLSELRKKGARKQLVELLEKMLAKDRSKRLATWVEVLAATARVKALMNAGLGAIPSAIPVATPVAARVSSEIALAVLAQRPVATLPKATSSALNTQPNLSASIGKRRTSATWLLLVVVVAVGLGFSAWWLLLRGEGPRAATPATLAEVLRSSAGQAVEIRLAPGIYGAVLRLGAAATGLDLRAAGPGVVLTGVTAEPGLRATLSGIEVRGPLTLGPGVQLELQGGSAHAVLVDGGRLTCVNTEIAGPIAVNHQGVLSLRGGRAGAGIRGEDSTIELHDCRISGAVQITRGALSATTTVISGNGEIPALALDRANGVTLHAVTLDSSAVGVAADSSAITALDGLTISASRVGIAWTGPADPTWEWRGLRVTAPTVASGLPATRVAAASASAASSTASSPQAVTHANPK